MFIGLSTSALNAQLLHDSANLKLVRKDIGYIYNLQFFEAHEVYEQVTTAYPDHPVVYLLRGMMTYWENFPLLNTSPAKDSFEEDLRQCIRLAESNSYPEHEAEYLLANLCARGFLLMFYADNDLVMEVIPLTTSTYKYVMRSFDFTSDCADLFYFTGMYNYYRDAYPRAYPVYKPLALLFPPGDLQRGIKELNIAANNSVVLAAESSYLLTYICMNFENDYSGAFTYVRKLHEQYPGNLQFFVLYLKNMLLLKQYDDAEVLIESLLTDTDNSYSQAQLSILKGIIKEKKYSDYAAASQLYNNGISAISLFGDYGNEYSAYAYFGLSRISDYDGEKHASQMYRRMALKLADFKKVNFDK